MSGDMAGGLLNVGAMSLSIAKPPSLSFSLVRCHTNMSYNHKAFVELKTASKNKKMNKYMEICVCGFLLRFPVTEIY